MSLAKEGSQGLMAPPPFRFVFFVKSSQKGKVSTPGDDGDVTPSNLGSVSIDGSTSREIARRGHY